MSKPPHRRSQEQFVLRLPGGLRDRIREAAERNGRSMNSEIVQVLEDAFPPPVRQEDVVREVFLSMSKDDPDRVRAVLLNIFTQTVGDEADWKAWLAQVPR